MATTMIFMATKTSLKVSPLWRLSKFDNLAITSAIPAAIIRFTNADPSRCADDHLFAKALRVTGSNPIRSVGSPEREINPALDGVKDALRQRIYAQNLRIASNGITRTAVLRLEVKSV